MPLIEHIFLLVFCREVPADCRPCSIWNRGWFCPLRPSCPGAHNPHKPFLLPEHGPHLHSRVTYGAREEKTLSLISFEESQEKRLLRCQDVRTWGRNLCWVCAYPWMAGPVPGLPGRPVGFHPHHWEEEAAAGKEAQDQGGSKVLPKESCLVPFFQNTSVVI